MPKYRVRVYFGSDYNNYFKVQERTWRGWKTVAKHIHISEVASSIVRDLLKAEKEFEGEDDATNNS